MADPTLSGPGLSHHHALLAAYAVTMACWDRVAHRARGLWPACPTPSFARPWREVGVVLLAIVATLAIGQLYVRHWLLPAAGSVQHLVDALNQLIIFAPILLVPVVRKQGWDSAWLPRSRVWLRVAAGVFLSLIAVLVFTTAREGSDKFHDVVPRVYHPQNLSYLVQVLCEDIAIAILFVRLRAALGRGRAIGLVAILFAAAHIPALIADGASAGDLLGLVLDAGLGVLVLWFVQRSSDVWWFWLVHFSLDMMQFYSTSP